MEFENILVLPEDNMELCKLQLDTYSSVCI